MEREFPRYAAEASCGHTSYDLMESNQWVQDTVSRLTPPGGRVMDLGCGPGRHLGPIHALGKEVYGVDRSLFRLSQSTLRPNAGLVLADMLHLPFQGGSFHTVVAWRSIYFQSRKRIIHTTAEIKRILRPGGVLVCSCRSTTNTLYFIGQEMGEEIEPGTFRLDDGIDFFDVSYHFFTEDEVREIFKGFHIETITERPLKHTRYTASRPEHQNNFWVFIARK